MQPWMVAAASVVMTLGGAYVGSAEALILGCLFGVVYISFCNPYSGKAFGLGVGMVAAPFILLMFGLSNEAKEKCRAYGQHHQVETKVRRHVGCLVKTKDGWLIPN